MTTTLPGANPPSDDTRLDIATTSANSIIHGCKLRWLLDDRASLYELVKATVARASEHGEEPTADAPCIVSRCDPSWVSGDTQYDVGVYASPTWYGPDDDNGTAQSSKYHLSLFSDGDSGKKLETSAKHTITLDRHDTSLKSTKGTPVPPIHGVSGDEYRLNTMVKAFGSYAATPQVVFDRSEELIRAVWGTSGTDAWTPLSDTARFADMEVHVRYARTRMSSVVETLSTNNRLLATDTEAGKLKGRIRKGHWDIFKFKTEPGFVEMGFEPDDSGATVASETIKTYLAHSADQRDSEDPLHHPKLEVCVHGWNSIKYWDHVRAHADNILFAHCDWADVSEEHFVSDDHFVAPTDDEFEGAGTTYYVPSGMRVWIAEYYRRDDVKNALIAKLHNSTQAYHDILLAMKYDTEGGYATYRSLAESTGYSERTIRRRVKDLVDDNILRRIHDERVFVDWRCDAASDLLDSLLTKGKTVKDKLTGMAGRAQDRVSKREGTDQDRSDSEQTPSRGDQRSSRRPSECSRPDSTREAEPNESDKTHQPYYPEQWSHEALGIDADEFDESDLSFDAGSHFWNTD